MSTHSATETRTALRETCNRLVVEIDTMERNGGHGTKAWHKLAQAFQKALRAHGDAGGSVAEVAMP